jgi:glutathione S-transferase
MSDGAAASKPRLTYFKILGLAEAIRLAFAEVGEEVENDYIDGDWAERKAAGIEVRGNGGRRRRGEGARRLARLVEFDGAAAWICGVVGAARGWSGAGEMDEGGVSARGGRVEVESVTRVSVTGLSLGGGARRAEGPAKGRCARVQSGALPFGQVPRLVDGDVDICQSKAILRHVGRTRGLYGSTEKEHSQVDMLVDTADDLRQAYNKVIYGGGEVTAEALAGFHKQLGEVGTRGGGVIIYLDRFLERTGGAFIAGTSTPTIADFLLFNTITYIQEKIPNVLQDADGNARAPRLEAWKQRVAERPNVAAYLSSKQPHFPATSA